MKNYETIEIVEKHVDEIVEVEKFNPNHDALGRFASGGGGSASSASGGSKKKTTAAGGALKKPSKMHPNEITSELIANRHKMKDAEWEERRALSKRNKELTAELKRQMDMHRTYTGKSADIEEVEVVEKFNPFHDNLGRFSNKNGFKSYSANPNTKAGAMAIARSAAAGHGKTRNVHRESYGEDIRQNANWLGRNNVNVGSRQTGSGTLRQRVEPKTGLAGASATGYTWAVQNRVKNRTTKPGKQNQNQQQTQQKPAPTKQTQPDPAQQAPKQTAAAANKALASKVSDVYLSSGDKLAIQARDWNGHTTTTKNVAKAHYQDRVDGKDISKTVDVTKIRGSKSPIDKIAELQGWNKNPTVTDDFELFQKAAKKRGGVMIRSVEDNRRNGKTMTAEDVCKATMTDGNSPLGGHGMKAYGSGMYMVKTDFGNSTGRNLSHKIARGQDESYSYGNKQMMATLHPDAKIATPHQANKMKGDFLRMSSSQQAKYGGWGEYIASKGYDGAQWHDSSDPGAYATVFNKSALIFYSGVSTR